MKSCRGTARIGRSSGEAASHYPSAFSGRASNVPGVHAIDYYMRQAGGPDGAIPRINVARGRPRIHRHPSILRQPQKELAAFRGIAEQLGSPVQFCVGPEQSWPGAVRYENLYDLAKWLATATLYIGNDSGITHLAAAVGVPVIAIFQASDRSIWAPRGRAAAISLVSPTVQAILERLL